MNGKRQGPLTPDDIRLRFAHTAPPRDPATPAAGDRGWPRALIEALARPLVPAAVLIPIVERERGLTVLLTERAQHLVHHPGQVSFPGGRVEPGDEDLAATALRETHEEVGIDPAQVDVAGYLDSLPTVTGYAVTPVVGLVDDGVSLALDPTEVDVAFEVPLAFLLDARNRRHSVRDFRGIRLPLIEFRYGPRRIWGATAAMIVALHEKLHSNN